MKWKSKINLLSLGIIFLLTSCNLAPEKTRDTTSRSSSSLEEGQAYIMMTNPAVQDIQKAILPLDVSQFLDSTGQLVTPNQTLKYDCKFNGFSVNGCMQALLDTNSTSPISRTGDTWEQEANSAEYLQVHTLFHAKKLVERFYSSLDFTRSYITGKSLPFSIAPSFPFNTLGASPLYWLGTSGAPQHTSTILDLVVFCPNFGDGSPNVTYSPAERRVCFGGNDLFTTRGFHFAQDPDVIYHEMGHVMVDIMMNLRNGASAVKTDLGFIAYDEAAAINEGVSDYFSYLITEKGRLAEWALGAGLEKVGFESAIRPVTDDDPLHITGISSDPNERLSYPQYLNYNPNSPSVEQEDVHNAGQIVSHYLVSLTKDLKSTCSIDQERAENYVMLLISETMAELGDLTGKATDFNTTSNLFFTNLSPAVSFDWMKTSQPINYKRFFQTFAKYALHYISMDLCTSYSKSKLEWSLDNYGLLLFSDYQDQGLASTGANSITDAVTPGTIAPLFSLTTVDVVNRTKTSLVSKSQLSLPGLEDTRAQVFLIDSATAVNNLITSKAFQGTPLNLTLSNDLAGIRYNNDNRYFSPGEVVGFSLNLVNDSNIPLSGVQILGNNWDHMKKSNPTDEYEKLCTIDGFPSTAGGGIEDLNPASPVPGDCNYASRPTASLAESQTDINQPVCFVQKIDNGISSWVTQNEFRQTPSIGLTSSECLGPLGDQNPNECLARIVPGGDYSVFSKIDPGKTWAETLYSNQQNPQFNSSGFIVMELSKWIPQGTLFNCRMRVRYTNCSDCYSDTNGSYPSAEFSGHKPYKIINFEFRVVN